MNSKRLKAITSFALAGALLVSSNIGIKASAKEVGQSSVQVSDKESLSKYKFLKVNVSKNSYQGIDIRGTLPKEIDQFRNKEKILRANADVLGIKNFDKVQLKDDFYGQFGISTFYQVINGYRVADNYIWIQPGSPRNDEQTAEASITVRFDESIFNNLNVTKTPEKITRQQAMDIVVKDANDKCLEEKTEVVIAKIKGSYHKVYLAETFNKGYYIDVTDGKILDTFYVYNGPTF